MTLSWQLEAEAPIGRGVTAQRYRLGNGLGLIAAVDKRAPIVALQTWFRVGSRHERAGRDRHGAPVRAPDVRPDRELPPGEFDRLVERTGGESNAATWVDWTYYQLSLPARDLRARRAARSRAHAAPRARADAGRGRARRRHERAPRARRGRCRRLARRAADGARVHRASVPLADDRLDGRHPRARAPRRSARSIARGTRRTTRRSCASATSTRAPARLDRRALQPHPGGAAAGARGADRAGAAEGARRSARPSRSRPIACSSATRRPARIIPTGPRSRSCRRCSRAARRRGCTASS